MIIFDYRLPSPGLREYVRLFQIVGFEFNENETVPWKPYWPRPEQCLSFYPRDTLEVEHINGHQNHHEPRATIIGQPCSLTKKFMVRKNPKQDFLLFQVVFQPGALFRLTGIPVYEITDTYINAEAVFSQEIKQVNQRLNSTDNHLEMVAIVEDFLYYLVRRVKYVIKPVDKIGLYLLHQPRPVSLDWLASEACLSRKQFYRKFVERMGVSPKMYSRIIQFDNAVKLKNAQPHKDWLSIALDLGYYDYQHLVRDFKEFTHLTPTAFYLLDSQAPERKFGHKEI